MWRSRGGFLLVVAGCWGGASACGSEGDDDQPVAGASGSSAGQAGGSGGKGGKGGNGGTAGALAGKGGSAGSDGEGGEAPNPGGAGGEGAQAAGGDAGTGEAGGGAGGAGSGGTSEAGAGGEGGASGPARDPRCDDAEPGVLDGSGESGDPYLLCLPEQLVLIGTEDYPLGSAYALGDTLDAGDASDTVGSDAEPFLGSFDGRGHSLLGLTATFLAVIGEGAQVFDLLVEGVVDATLAPTSFGIVTNRNLGTLRDVHVLGGVVGGSHVGLLAGTNEGLVEVCSAGGTIDDGGAHVGGLLGVNLGTLRRSWSSVSVTANGRVGGLVGRQTAPGLIEESFALGSAAGEFAVGGLVGTLFSGEIRDSYARASSVSGPEAGGLVGDITGGDATLTRCYAATSSLVGEGAEGLVGELAANTVYQITASYFLDSAEGSLGEALTAAEMQTADSFEAWDFEAIWQFDTAESPYPTLRFRSGAP